MNSPSTLDVNLALNDREPTRGHRAAASVVHTPDSHDRLCAADAKLRWIVDGIIAEKTVNIGVGDSGLGKAHFSTNWESVWPQESRGWDSTLIRVE